MKGIVLAGGSGSRLYPLTKVVSKQLQSVYDKPMIFYSLSILMLAGIREILLISTTKDLPLFQEMFGDGRDYGLSLSYQIQERPNGIGEAFLLAEDFIGGESCALILGDNFFYGHALTGKLKEAMLLCEGACIFPYWVSNPERFGVIAFGEDKKILSIEEKPKEAKSNYVIPGLYFFDQTVVEKAKKISCSERGELEITSILELYWQEDSLKTIFLGRGSLWFDMGTEEALFDAANFVRSIQNQQGTMIACLEEIAYEQGWIGKEDLERQSAKMGDSKYRSYVESLRKR